MSTSFNRLRFLVAAALLFSAAQRLCLADSATWTISPTSGDWNTATNWTPRTVPNSTTDIATFDASNVTNVSVSLGSVINLDSAVFNSGAPAYTITLDVSNLILNGTGFVNNSGSVQSVLIPEQDHLIGGLFLFNSASAGIMTTYSGGFFDFEDFSSAGSSTFDVSSDSLQASMSLQGLQHSRRCDHQRQRLFRRHFFDSSSGGNSPSTSVPAAFAPFEGSNNAEHMTGKYRRGPEVSFADRLRGLLQCRGRHLHGRWRKHERRARRADPVRQPCERRPCHLRHQRRDGSRTERGKLLFLDITSAADASITVNGGVDGSAGGVVSFEDKSKGGKWASPCPAMPSWTQPARRARNNHRLVGRCRLGPPRRQHAHHREQQPEHDLRRSGPG